MVDISLLLAFLILCAHFCVSKDFSFNQNYYFIFHFIQDAQNYQIKLRNIECKNIDDKYVKNVTCYIKAVRKMLGVLYTEYTFVKAPDVVYGLKSFFRNSHGHYQPFIFRIEIDVCSLNKIISKFDFGLRKWVAQAFQSGFPAFWSGCPLSVKIKKKIKLILSINF